jgi:hypothetical protein
MSMVNLQRSDVYHVWPMCHLYAQRSQNRILGISVLCSLFFWNFFVLSNGLLQMVISWLCVMIRYRYSDSSLLLVRSDSYILSSVVELMQSLITRSGFYQPQILPRKLSCYVSLSFNSSIYPSIHPSTCHTSCFSVFYRVSEGLLGWGIGGSECCETFTTTGQHKHKRIAYILVSSGFRTHSPCIRRKGYSLSSVSQGPSDRLLTPHRKYWA